MSWRHFVVAASDIVNVDNSRDQEVEESPSTGNRLILAAKELMCANIRL